MTFGGLFANDVLRLINHWRCCLSLKKEINHGEIPLCVQTFVQIPYKQIKHIFFHMEFSQRFVHCTHSGTSPLGFYNHIIISGIRFRKYLIHYELRWGEISFFLLEIYVIIQFILTGKNLNPKVNRFIIFLMPILMSKVLFFK